MSENTTFGYEETFQKAVVAAALKDPAFLMQYSDVLMPSYFDYEYLSSILRTARELTERLNAVPSKMTLVEEMKDYCMRFNIAHNDRNFIFNKLEEVYAIEVTDLAYIREKIVQFGQRQALRLAVQKIVQTVSGKDSSPDAYDKARTTLESALRVGFDSREPGLSLYPNLENLPMLASSGANGLTRKVPTLIPTLDQKTMGGPGRGEVWTVCGLPGRGKSAFLVNIGAAALKNGYAVFHYTIGDLNEVDVGVRYAARLTMCSTFDVIKGTENYINKARVIAKYNPHLHIKFFPSGQATMGHVRAHCSRLKSINEVSPAVIIIDYPEELRTDNDNMYLAAGDNYTAISALASEFDAVIWTASQPQRWQPDKASDVIKGQNIGESWKKFQKLDGFVSWNMSYDDELAGRAKLWVDKTRRAKSFYLVHMDVDMERMFIKEGKAPEDEPENGGQGKKKQKSGPNEPTVLTQSPKPWENSKLPSGNPT